MYGETIVDALMNSDEVDAVVPDSVAALGADAGGRRRHHRGARRGAATRTRRSRSTSAGSRRGRRTPTARNSSRQGYPVIPGLPPRPQSLPPRPRSRAGPGKRRSWRARQFPSPLRLARRAGRRLRPRSPCCKQAGFPVAPFAMVSEPAKMRRPGRKKLQFPGRSQSRTSRDYAQERRRRRPPRSC